MGSICNIVGDRSFVDELAAKFLRDYADSPEDLAQILFVLPNRRSCQSLADAFIRQKGMQPTILPRIEPIADSEEAEIFLSADKSVLESVLPAMDSCERLLTFTRLIKQKPELGIKNVSLSQAYALAENLAELMDQAANENLNFSGLQKLVSEEYAAHWQQILQVLQIITEFWPDILKERGLVDQITRRNLLLRAEMDLWRKDKNGGKLVVAGTTAAYPIFKELVKTALEIPQGEVYLYGLDVDCDEEYWNKIDENHPQFELKELLEYLKIDRRDVINLCPEKNSPRSVLVSEIMRPAVTSDKWRNLAVTGIDAQAFDGLKMINCDDVRQEAETIALIIRHTLQTPEKTAALVTMDRDLSRRVVSELHKWDINADDSAGQPLHLTALGIYLRLLIAYIENADDTNMMALMKHPFVSCGRSRSDFNISVKQLELSIRRQIPLTAEQQTLLADFKARLEPLQRLYRQSEVSLSEILAAHIKSAEHLSDTPDKSGAALIWRHDAGNVAADAVSNLLNKSSVLPKIKPAEYGEFFSNFLSGYNVRIRYGMHPRVKILGPIESRLNQYDVTIIGEINEGVWPKAPTADMWMSRPMKKNFGLPLPERSIGVTASDFAHLMQAPQVYLVRAKKADGTPTCKSRWWLRLETVLDALFDAKPENYAFIYNQPYSSWARELHRRDRFRPIAPPHPCPPLELRPRELSATNIEKLRRNPYYIYAKNILSLLPLPDLDEPIGARELGNFLHELLQKFNDAYPHEYPENAYGKLQEMCASELDKLQLATETKAFWQPRLQLMLKWIVATENMYRPGVKKVCSEIKGAVNIPGKYGNFRVTAKADRIDETIDGYLNIIDYKTGRDSTAKAMASGNAMQLPIEGLIAETGGFPGIMPKKVKSLQYWAFKKKINATTEEDSSKAITLMTEILRQMVDSLDSPDYAYIVNPVHGAVDDYDHLSRLDEWSVREDGSQEGDDADE